MQATTQAPPFVEEDNDLRFGTERPFLGGGGGSFTTNNDNSNSGFSSPRFPQRRPAGSGPRVKSDILARQRNRGRGGGGRGGSRFGGRNRNNFFNRRPSPTTTAAPFSNEEFPEFIDEIDEIEERPRTGGGFGGGPANDFENDVGSPFVDVTPRPPFVASTPRPFVSSTARPFVSSTARPFVSSTVRPFVSSTARPVNNNFNAEVLRQQVPPRKTPRVKSNILASKGKKNKKNRGRNRNRNRVEGATFNFGGGSSSSSSNNNNSGFSNSNTFAQSGGDSRCTNPFKCPPKSVADGRRPRVKSNIKARKRKFHRGFRNKANQDNTAGRISGRVRPNASAGGRQPKLKTVDDKAQQTRAELDQLLAQLKARRQGKAVDRRVKPADSHINSGAHSSNLANEFRSETTARPEFDGGNAFFGGSVATTTLRPRRPNPTRRPPSPSRAPAFSPTTLAPISSSNNNDDDDEYEYYYEEGEEYYYADDFEAGTGGRGKQGGLTTTQSPFFVSTTSTTTTAAPPATTTFRPRRPSGSPSGFFDSSTHRPIIASTRRLSPFSPTRRPRPFVTSTLLPVVQPEVSTLQPISESPPVSISTTRRPKQLNNRNNRPRGFPSKEELLSLARGEKEIPGFPRHRTVPATSSSPTGLRTRFPPRQRPTPAAGNEPQERPRTASIGRVQQPPPPPPPPSPAPAPSLPPTRQPVTLPRGVASSAVLDPKLPPIPTLPPDHPVPVQHVSFLDKTAGRDGTRPRPNNNKKNKNKKNRNRQPRVKSDLQQAQINRWSRKGQKKFARQNKSFDRSQVNFVTTTAAPFLIRLGDDEEEESFNEIEEDDPPVTTSRRPFVSSTLLPVTAAPFAATPSPRPASVHTRRPGSRRRPPFGVSRQPPFRTTIRTTRSPSIALTAGLENDFATGRSRHTTAATTTVAPPPTTAPAEEEESNELFGGGDDQTSEEVKIIAAFNDRKVALRPDGRQPRVKSDIRQKKKNKGKNNKNNRNGGGGRGRNGRGHKKPLRVGLPGSEGQKNSRFHQGAGRSIDLDASDDENEIGGVEDNKETREQEQEEIGNDISNPDDDQPKVRPDGQKPRVKSDILARGGGGGGRRGGGGGRRKKNKFRHSKRVEPDQKVKFVFQPTPTPEVSEAEERIDVVEVSDDDDDTGNEPFFTINTRAVSTTTEAGVTNKEDTTSKKEKKENEDKMSKDNKKMKKRKKQRDDSDEYEYDYYYYEEFHDHHDEEKVNSPTASSAAIV